MKKSDILKSVLKAYETMNDEQYGRVYICNEIEEQFMFYHSRDEAYTTAKSVIRWIQKSLNDPNNPLDVENYGVEAWLVHHGHKQKISFGDHEDTLTMREYRKRWLANMIAYWESKGD